MWYGNGWTEKFHVIHLWWSAKDEVESQPEEKKLLCTRILLHRSDVSNLTMKAFPYHPSHLCGTITGKNKHYKTSTADLGLFESWSVISIFLNTNHASKSQ